MKRELKALLPSAPSLFSTIAAAQIPMKRELKGLNFSSCPKGRRGCSPNPYEEGTERIPHTKWSVSFFP